MSIRKKVVWLPYDMDTAIGINNDGQLVFSYRLEDIDWQPGGEPVYNGQRSVIWQNIRAAFADELKAMYFNLRSSGALSYEKVEQMFEEHQNKWSEAIFNEDSYFKYIEPFMQDNENYLYMLQGSKAEQRKWWLYNRFRYIDSKYVAGDARNDSIFLRPYAADDITVTPYADIYATVAWDATITQERATRGVAVTLHCPYSSMSGNIVNIYSASQLASIGDLSSLKVGQVNIAKATRLQALKIGDASNSYSNQNLYDLTFGNNVLLKTVDVRNCVGFGDTTMQGHTQTTVDLSGCSIIENVYLEGTKLQGVTLPNGGVLKVLHLPETITNLTIMNHKSLTDLVVGGYNNISTLRLENVPRIDSLSILRSVNTGTRVRLIGVRWEAQDAEEISDIFDLLDSMRGLDESGNNTEKAQLSGIIHTNSLTGAEIEEFNSRYPYVNVIADHTTTTLTYKTWDGSSNIKVVTCIDGVPQEAAPSVPARTATAQYTFTGIGWNATQDASVDDPSAITNVTTNRVVYAAYSRVVNTYTITWKNNGTTIRTDTNVAWGTKPVWGQAMPTNDGQTATGWDYDLDVGIVGNTTINAKYTPQYTATFVLATEDSYTGSQYTLYTKKFDEGSTPVYSGDTPTTAQGDTTEFEFVGWSPTLAPIYANTTYVAQFQDNRAVTIQYLSRNISAYESNNNTTFAGYGLGYATKLTSAKAPVTSVDEYAFANDTNLEVVDLSATSGAVTIANNAFSGCTNLQHLIIRSSTMATLSSKGAFTGTPIALGEGAVYVPTSLVATYKANTNWSNYYIADIADYPINDFSTVTDSWSTIIANANYATDYSVGDIKLVDFGTFGQHYFELVAIDEDTKASGGTARMTWMNKNLLTMHVMNTRNTTTGGYDASNMKSWITSDVLPQLQSEIRNAIVPVTKISGTYENSAVVVNGQSTTESLWIPSEYEIFGTTTYENTGARYSKFNSNASRIKYNLSSSIGNWWLRSAYSTYFFRYVNSSGGANGISAYSTNGVVLGFCI